MGTQVEYLHAPFAFPYVSLCGARYIFTHSFTDSANFLAVLITFELSFVYNSILRSKWAFVIFVSIRSIAVSISHRTAFFPMSDSTFFPFSSISGECCSFICTGADVDYVVNNETIDTCGQLGDVVYWGAFPHIWVIFPLFIDRVWYIVIAFCPTGIDPGEQEEDFIERLLTRKQFTLREHLLSGKNTE